MDDVEDLHYDGDNIDPDLNDGIRPPNVLMDAEKKRFANFDQKERARSECLRVINAYWGTFLVKWDTISTSHPLVTLHLYYAACINFDLPNAPPKIQPSKSETLCPFLEIADMPGIQQQQYLSRSRWPPGVSFNSPERMGFDDLEALTSWLIRSKTDPDMQDEERFRFNGHDERILSMDVMDVDEPEEMEPKRKQGAKKGARLQKLDHRNRPAPTGKTKYVICGNLQCIIVFKNSSSFRTQGVKTTRSRKGTKSTDPKSKGINGKRRRPQGSEDEGTFSESSSSSEEEILLGDDSDSVVSEDQIGGENG